MKRLILVRHAIYGHDDHLNDDGKFQIRRLGEKLKETFNGDRVAILTSTAHRARESAEILGSLFGLPFEEHEVLWSENSHPEDMEAALELVRSKSDVTDTLILVTHLEYVEKFPYYFGRQELEGTPFQIRPIMKGEAWDIDCVGKTIQHIRV